MCLNFFLLIDHNNNPFSTHNSSNLHFNYPNPNTYQFQNQFSNTPQSMQNYGFAPNIFMLSPVPNYPPYYWSIMSNLSQRPPFFSMGIEIAPNTGATIFFCILYTNWFWWRECCQRNHSERKCWGSSSCSPEKPKMDHWLKFGVT